MRAKSGRFKILMRWLILALTLALMILPVVPVYAISLPDSDATLESVNVYRNLLETGDRLFVIYANIPYATTPDDPVTETFIWRLIDTDNTTVLGSTIGYAYNESGYGYNVWSLYFDASDNLTWGSAYTLRLSGTPSAFASPPEYNFSVTSGDYTSFTTNADNEAALAARVVALAGELDVRWGLSASDSLLSQGESTTVLSIYGEAVFRGAIQGLQSMAPAAFSVVVRDIDVDDRTWTTGYADNLTTQYDTTWIETARDASASLFGKTYDLPMVMLMLIFCVALIIGNVMLTNDAWNGLIDVALLAIIGARLDLYAIGFLMLIGAICIIYLGLRIFRIV